MIMHGTSRGQCPTLAVSPVTRCWILVALTFTTHSLADDAASPSLVSPRWTVPGPADPSPSQPEEGRLSTFEKQDATEQAPQEIPNTPRWTVPGPARAHAASAGRAASETVREDSAPAVDDGAAAAPDGGEGGDAPRAPADERTEVEAKPADSHADEEGESLDSPLPPDQERDPDAAEHSVSPAGFLDALSKQAEDDAPHTPIGDEAEISTVLNDVARDSAIASSDEKHSPLPPTPPLVTSASEVTMEPPKGTQQSCHAKGRILEEPMFKTVLKTKRRCRAGWMEYPTSSVLIAGYARAYAELRAKGVIGNKVEVIGVTDVFTVKPNEIQNLAVKTWTGQNHFLIHSKQPVKIAEAADRMLRMTAAQRVSFVITNQEESNLLTKGWMDKVKELFVQHPKLGMVGASRGILEGLPFTGTPGSFRFVEKTVGGPIAVRRGAYYQASVYLSSAETCGAEAAKCTDPGQIISARLWAAGYQVGVLPVGNPTAPSSCPDILSTDKQAIVKNLAAQANMALTSVKGTSNSVTTFSTMCKCSQVGPNAPELSAIVQYFRRREGIKPIAENFNAVGSKLEVIINDDSMSEGDAWITALQGNAFVAYCHDVHEIRGYNRLSRFASANYIAAMQDDDVPKDTAWVRRATSLFKNHPRLAMLGGFRGRMDVGNHFDKGTGQMWGKKYGPHYLPIPLQDKQAGVPYMPMYKVNAAPLVYDKRVFSELGGFNYNFSCVGDSGIDFDFEYSIRLWKMGYVVALTDLRLRHGAMDKTGAASKSGTRADKKKWDARRDAERFNNAQLYAMYQGYHHKEGTAAAMREFVLERQAQSRAPVTPKPAPAKSKAKAKPKPKPKVKAKG